jgi:hypothetical protein
LSMRLI